MIVAKDDRRCLLGWQLRERCREIAMLDQLLRVRSEPRPANAADHLTHLTEPHLALVRDRRVDRDPVHPCFSRRDRLPGSPLFVSPLERILGAILCRRPVAEHRGERAEDLSI